jgi:hypothetical protein
MNSAQRLLVITSLVVIGLVLAFVFLDFGEGAFNSLGGDRIALIVLYKDPTQQSSWFGSGYGLYTLKGIPGVMLGVVLPLCLFASLRGPPSSL